MTRIAPEQLAETFVKVADTLVADFDLVEFLQDLVGRVSDLIAARAVGLLLADPEGRLQLMAASDERTEMLELFQAQVLEGPCQDCYRQHRAVVVPDLGLRTARWPNFAPLAVGAGIRAVHAFPLRCRDQVIGALNLFGAEPGELTAQDAAVVQSLADVATISILQERTIRRGETLSDNLQGALESRVAVEQAKGMLASIFDETPDEAFRRLRNFCRRRGLRISEVSAAMVRDPATAARLLDG